MAKWLPCCAFVVFLCAAVQTGISAAPQSLKTTAPAPRIVLSESEIDLGRLEPKAPLKPLTVTIRNAGDAPLEIRKVRSSCPCLSTDLSNATIMPGSTATLRLQGKLLPFEESFDEQALIYSNDTAQPAVKVHLSGPVTSAIMIDPNGVPVGLVYRGILGGRKFPPIQLTAADHAPIGPIRAVPSSPAIHAETRQGQDGTYEVEITVDPTVPIGPLNEVVRVETRHPRVPVIEIPVIGRILGDLDPLGRVVDFGLIKEGTTASAECLLKSLGNKQIQITKAEVKLPVPADVKVTPAGHDFQVQVRVASAPAFTSLKGVVELHTNNPDQPIALIEIHGGVLANHPFEQAAAAGSDAGLFAIVEDALRRGDRIPPELFFSDVLGGVKDQRAVALLLRAATESDLPVRMRAVELLSPLKTPDVLERLRGIITDDPHQFVRRLALVGYADALQKKAIPELLVALQDDEGWVREDAAKYLEKFGDSTVIPALRAVANDPDPEANAAIKKALFTLQSAAK